MSRFADKYTTDNSRIYNYRKAISRIVWTLAIIVIADIWIEGLTSLATYLGLVSAGIAIALKDPLTDIAGWFFITLRKPFEMSHRIEIGQHKGNVVGIRIFKFTILEIGGWVGGPNPPAGLFTYPIPLFSGKVWPTIPWGSILFGTKLKSLLPLKVIGDEPKVY